MNFLEENFPCSVDKNAFKAYINPRMCNKRVIGRKRYMNAFDMSWACIQPDTLRCLVLDKIAENWDATPIYSQIPRQEDKNYLLTKIDLNLPIKTLSSHIKDDFFWRKSFLSRWSDFHPNVVGRKWINVYMEKHLQEYLENLETVDYDPEHVQSTLDICAPYVVRLEVDFLQPSMGERNDHIPLDFILANLPELRYFRLTYCTKTVDTNFYLGCSKPSRNDIEYLRQGLSKCFELAEFFLHSVSMEPYMMDWLGKALDKGCSSLVSLSIRHCTVTDEGISKFLKSCNKDSLPHLRVLDLANNMISCQGALMLSKALYNRQIDSLLLKLNPIGSEGAAVLFSILQSIKIKRLNLSGCSLTENITKLLLKVIMEVKSLEEFKVSNNHLGLDFGRHIFQIIGFNKTLQRIDLRNTGVSVELRNQIDAILRKNF